MAKRLGLVLGGFFAALIIAEVALRLLGIFIGNRLPELYVKKRPGQIRILTLGESTTVAAVYSQTGRDISYPAVLQRELNKSAPGKFAVVNAGISGVDSAYIASELDHILDEAAPDIVVMMMGINDSFYTLRYKQNALSDVLLTFRELKVFRLIKMIHMRIKFSIDSGSIALLPHYEDTRLLDYKVDRVVYSTTQEKLEIAAELRAKMSEIAAQAQNEEEIDWSLAEEIGITIFFKIKDYNLQLQLAEEWIKKMPDDLEHKRWMYESMIFMVGRNESPKVTSLLIERFQNEGHLSENEATLLKKRMIMHLPPPENMSSIGEVPQALYYNYRNIIKRLKSQGIEVIAMQYPLLSKELLERILGDYTFEVTMVLNRSNFVEALKRSSFFDIFVDIFARDFGHCSERGNLLIAKNLEQVLLKKYYSPRDE